MKGMLKRFASMMVVFALTLTMSGVKTVEAATIVTGGCLHSSTKQAPSSSYSHSYTHKFLKKVNLTASGSRYYYEELTCEVLVFEAYWDIYCAYCGKILDNVYRKEESHSACMTPFELDTPESLG